MMELCPPNISFFDIWVDHGMSECSMDTATSTFLALFIFVFGGTQLWMYKKYATRAFLVNNSKLYYLQVLINIFLCLVVVVKYTLDATVLHYKTVFIYQIISAGCLLFSIMFATYLTSLERNYGLPSIPTRGHGLILLSFWTLLLIFANLTFINLKRQDWWFSLQTTDDKIEMYLFICYYVGTLALFVLGIKAPGLTTPGNYLNLSNSSGGEANNQNREQDLLNPNTSAWSNIGTKIKILAPYLWPYKSHQVKLRVFFCLLLLILARVINVYVPIYNKLLINSMIDKPLAFRWDYVLIFVGFKFLQGGGTGGMGLLNNVRSYVWIGVQQYTVREIDIELFRHIHSLSLRWHLSRKTGEVIRIMNRGTDSVTNLLNNILFQIVPTLVDIVIAVVFFVAAFNAWYGFIVFTTMLLYLVLSIVVTEWRTKFQRQMNLADNAMSSRATDSLLNFETVKYYGADEYEIDEYKKCINTYQTEEYKNALSLVFLNSIQNMLITGGLLAGSLLCVHQVVNEQTLTVGDYTLFASYILQLYVPLNWFGMYYRSLQRNFVDMENMFQLLNESADVNDDPEASLLCVTHGAVEFRNVSFNYLPEQILLQNVSFKVDAGKTLALVGQSGSGKSTIIRLLFRFWDAETGDIFIDGQNIRNVTQASLRQAIGVVPQDTVLFNNSIKFNIRYAKTTASDDEVVEAAKNADIHDRIQQFPAGYETQVGERGLKLSGGEKQRVAIARTLLKGPDIVLLDEATSALDTHTERNIQSALNKACVNRTTIIVAHRLSTIIHADEILVMHEGKVVERGRHEELLSNKGTYASMWKSQSESQNSAATETPSVSDDPTSAVNA